MRSIALDIHRDFCEVAIKDGGEVRSAGRIKIGAVELELNHVYTVAHGKITRMEGYFTRKQTLQAAGLSE